MLSSLTLLLVVVLFVSYTLGVVSGEYVVKTTVSGLEKIITGVIVAIVVESYKTGDCP